MFYNDSNARQEMHRQSAIGIAQPVKSQQMQGQSVYSKVLCNANQEMRN